MSYRTARARIIDSCAPYTYTNSGSLNVYKFRLLKRLQIRALVKEAGGIDSLGSIPGLHKSFKIPSLLLSLFKLFQMEIFLDNLGIRREKKFKMISFQVKIIDKRLP